MPGLCGGWVGAWSGGWCTYLPPPPASPFRPGTPPPDKAPIPPPPQTRHLSPPAPAIRRDTDGQAPVGMNPTGMHSCSGLFFRNTVRSMLILQGFHFLTVLQYPKSSISFSKHVSVCAQNAIVYSQSPDTYQTCTVSLRLRTSVSACVA